MNLKLLRRKIGNYNTLMDENRELASFFFTEESMKTSKKEKFYSTLHGLPNFETLKLVVDTVGTSSLKQRGRPTFLGDFQEIFLTLMKLRLDLSEEDIAYRFRISQSILFLEYLGNGLILWQRV